jgi:hypothetical protein
MNSWENDIDRLRRNGWNVRWFSYLNRAERTVWRAIADKQDGPNFTIEADSLPEALAGLVVTCRPSEPDASDDVCRSGVRT